MKHNRTNPANEITLSMALTDFLPVVLFGIGGIIANGHLKAPLFIIGVLLSTFAGVCKAGWKLILAVSGQDRQIMPKLFHIFMPLGFAVIISSILFSLQSWGKLLHEMFSMPSLVFTLIGCAGMVMMGVFAKVMDGKKANSNWIEQVTNTAAQLCFVIALLII